MEVNTSTTLVYEYEEILKLKSKLSTSYVDAILDMFVKLGRKIVSFIFEDPS